MNIKVIVLALLFVTAILVGTLAFKSKANQAIAAQTAELRALNRRGAMKDALTLADSLRTSARKTFLSDSNLLAGLYREISASYERVQRFGDSEIVLRKALAEVTGKKKFDIEFSIRKTLQTNLIRQKKFEAALTELAEVDRQYTTDPALGSMTAVHQPLFDLTASLAELLIGHSKAKEAAIPLSRLQKHLEQHSGLAKSAMYRFMHAKARHQRLEGNLKGATSTFESLIALRAKEGATDVVSQVETLRELAVTYCLSKNPAAADTVAERAITTLNLKKPVQDLDVARIHLMVGKCFFAQKDYRRAETRLLSYSKACSSKCQSAQIGEFLNALAYLGLSQTALGRKKEGNATLTRAADLALKKFGKEVWITKQLQAAAQGKPHQFK